LPAAKSVVFAACSQVLVMPRARVVEYDYYRFLQQLRRASDSGRRIDKSDGARWAQYVRDKQVNEVAATAIARQKFERAVPVILDEGRDTDGLYFFSKDEEGCLRLAALD
jgi:hypothetical protein